MLLDAEVVGDGGQRGQVLVDRAQARAHRVHRHVGGAGRGPPERVPRRPAGRSPRHLTRPSISIADGSRPAAVADRATMSRGLVELSAPAPSSGTIRRPTGRRAPAQARDAAPNHTGIGRCTGSGARPAPVTRWYLPSNVTVWFGPQPPHQLDLLAQTALPRLVKSSPSASYSTAFQPSPTPNRRPALAEQVNLGGLLGDKHGLPLRQDERPRSPVPASW